MCVLQITIKVSWFYVMEEIKLYYKEILYLYSFVEYIGLYLKWK